MKVTLRKNILYFDEEATQMIKQIARAEHRTLKQVVIAGLLRGVKRATKEANQRMESSQISSSRRT